MIDLEGKAAVVTAKPVGTRMPARIRVLGPSASKPQVVVPGSVKSDPATDMKDHS